MMLIGSEFKRIRVRNIVNFPARVEKTHPMFIGYGIFHITGKITLTGQLSRPGRARFITENQRNQSDVHQNASFLIHSINRNRVNEWNVDFTISLGGVNGRSLFFQGEIRVGARNFSPLPCVFNGIIDQVG